MNGYAAEADSRRARQKTVVIALRKLGIAADRQGDSSVSLSLEDAERVLAALRKTKEADR